MAEFSIKIYIEAFAASKNSDEFWLGRALTVALAGPPSGPFTDDDKNKLRKWLRPWRWKAIHWNDGNITQGGYAGKPEHELPTHIRQVIRQLEDYLEFLIAGDDWEKRTRCLYLEHRTDDISEIEENMPLWPGVLSQLSRSGSKLSHQLNLADLHSTDNPGNEVNIKKIVFEDGDDPDSTQFEQSESLPPDYLEPNGRNGLIDHDTRLVVPDETDLTTADWLTEFPYRLGQAVDPIMRLADLLEIDSSTATPEPGVSIKEVLGNLLLHLAGGNQGDYQAAHLEPLLLAVTIAADLEVDMTSADRFAHEWSKRFGDHRQTFVSGYLEVLNKAIRLREGVLDSETDLIQRPIKNLSADQLREIHAGSASTTGLRAAMVAAMPATEPVANRVNQWLGTADNLLNLLHTLLPQRLAERKLLPPLAAHAGGQDGDWTPLKAKFEDVFKEVLDSLGLRFDPALVKRVVAGVFHLKQDGGDQDPLINQDSVDQAARDGLPFRADGVFVDVPDHAGQDIHELLDGYLLAVSASQTDGSWSDYALVSQGEAVIVHEPGKRSIAPKEEDAWVPNVYCPLPMVFDLSHKVEMGENLEQRLAVNSYRGEALIPRTALEAPEDAQADKDDVPQLEIFYRPARSIAMPPLAYGCDYKLICGYQAPGGLLPEHFHSGDGLTFDAQAVKEAERFVLQKALRRTLRPGPPRFLGENRLPANFAGPADANVRPLWREHLALWPDDQAGSRKDVEDSPTLFLDGEGQDKRLVAGSRTFIVRPPALALGDEEGEKRSGARVWRYWRERDRQWSGETGKVLDRLEEAPAREADDPAVVGLVCGRHKGKGGVLFRLKKIGPKGLEETGAEKKFSLVSGSQVTVTILLGQGGPEFVASEDNAALLVRLPQDGRFLLEALTACDKDFFPGGVDVRMFNTLISREKLGDECLLFGASRLVIETLPSVEHLPEAERIWKCIGFQEDELTGRITARLELPAESIPAFDHISILHSTWQRWRWDGGPVFGYSEFDLEASEAEPVENDRGLKFVQFEEVMFEDRREGGKQAEVSRSAGRVAELCELENTVSRGADYLRLRLEVRSRYAPLRPRSSGNIRRGAVGRMVSAKEATRSWQRFWRGYTIAARRRERLPTPRISLAAPLFGRIEDAPTTAGGIALYLDHPLFDTCHGGGLEEKLEVAIDIEFSEDEDESVPMSDGRAALAAGLDPTKCSEAYPFTGDGQPTLFWHRKMTDTTDSNGSTTPPENWFSKEGLYNGKPAGKPLRVSTVLGLTLEPNSPAPQFPFSVAIIDPALAEGAGGTIALKPGAMVKIRARTTLATSYSQDLASDWSASQWVLFLPDSAGKLFLPDSAGKKEKIPLFIARKDENAIVLQANPKLPKNMADPYWERLKDMVKDKASPEVVGPDVVVGPYLVNGLAAVLIRTVTDASGDMRARVESVQTGELDGTGAIRFANSSHNEITHIRLVEVHQVLNSGAQWRTTGGGDKVEASKRWFGENLYPTGEGGRLGAKDVEEGVTALGPLIVVVQ